MNNIYFGFDVEFISVKYNFFFDLGNVFGGILRFVVEDNQSWGVFGGSFYIVDICIKIKYLIKFNNLNWQILYLYVCIDL